MMINDRQVSIVISIVTIIIACSSSANVSCVIWYIDRRTAKMQDRNMQEQHGATGMNRGGADLRHEQ